MSVNGSTTISLEGHIYTVFNEACDKLGVDFDTLAMMAISGFLNSPLVSGDLNERSSITIDSTSQASEPDSGPEIIPFLVDALDGEVVDSNVFDGIRVSDIDFGRVPAIPIYSCDEDTILWGQFSRFLPIKVSLRILAGLSKENNSPVRVDDWFTSIFEWAPSVRKYLRSVDKENRIPRGEQFASGFPKSPLASGVKSINRYLNHSCASIYKDGKVVGFPAHLGLIHVEGEGEFEERLVSLTQAGLEYVAMSNPVIDEESTSTSMSPDESQFMMDKIEESLPASWGFLRFVLSSVAGGEDTPNELSAAIARLYGKGTSRNWNNKQVPTYRTGAIGLLGDMGLMSRTWNFRSVTYSVTDKGKEVLKQ